VCMYIYTCIYIRISVCTHTHTIRYIHTCLVVLHIIFATQLLKNRIAYGMCVTRSRKHAGTHTLAHTHVIARREKTREEEAGEARFFDYNCWFCVYEYVVSG